MQNFDSFVKELTGRPELYDHYETFYIRARNADVETRKTYNAVKNALMSYVAKLNRDECVKAGLEPKNEVFTAGEMVAKLVLSGGRLFIHLNVPPYSLDTRRAMFRVSDEGMVVYKLEKQNVIDQVLEIIPMMMSSKGYVSSDEYQEEDYASFYSREVEDETITTIVLESQKEYEENEALESSQGPTLVIESTPEFDPSALDDDIDYSEYYDEGARERKLKRNQKVSEGAPTDEELRREEKERKQKKRKPKLFRELANYGYEFVWFKIVAFYLITILIAVALGIAFQLKPLWIAILAGGFLLMMPGLVKSYFRNKYEERRYDEVTTYIEQMLYSFRKNSKILVSLRDALTVFPEHTKMHDTIIKAIHYAQSTNTAGNLYANTLSIIEHEYPCRRIRSLHRYMIKVEGLGGDHSAGVDALLKDRRLWVERIEGYRKEAATTLTDIFISIGFAVVLSCLIVRLMETPLVSIPDNLFYQISTVVFLLVSAYTVRMATKKTVLLLEDGESEVNSRRIINKIDWLRNYDPKNEFKHSAILSAIFSIFIIVGLLMKNALLIVLGALLIVYALTLRAPMKRRSSIKAVCREIEKVYPDWLLELALLLQIDNLHISIEKTLETAPLILKGELTQLANDIIVNPTGIEPFSSFFDFLPVNHVHSSMLLLYSLSEFGEEKGSTMLLELVERNSLMMDRAEKYKNDDRLAVTFAIKFIPMGISALKLMCDLAVMLISYMAILTGAM